MLDGGEGDCLDEYPRSLEDLWVYGIELWPLGMDMYFSVIVDIRLWDSLRMGVFCMTQNAGVDAIGSGECQAGWLSHWSVLLT